MSNYTYLDPLEGVGASIQPDLEDKRAADGKSMENPPREGSSEWYTSCPVVFTPPGADGRNNNFDFHIYYASPSQLEHARKLYTRIRLEFPELRIYKFWETPVGPHPVPMFECNTFNPAQTGALMSFLVAYRGPLSVLIHPNTGDDLRDHTERATWMGERYPLILDIFNKPH